MTILNLFIDFMNSFLSFEILGFNLYTYLIVFTCLILVFKILNTISNKN